MFGEAQASQTFETNAREQPINRELKQANYEWFTEATARQEKDLSSSEFWDRKNPFAVEADNVDRGKKEPLNSAARLK